MKRDTEEIIMLRLENMTDKQIDRVKIENSHTNYDNSVTLMNKVFTTITKRHIFCTIGTEWKPSSSSARFQISNENEYKFVVDFILSS